VCLATVARPTSTIGENGQGVNGFIRSRNARSARLASPDGALRRRAQSCTVSTIVLPGVGRIPGRPAWASFSQIRGLPLDRSSHRDPFGPRGAARDFAADVGDLLRRPKSVRTEGPEGQRRTSTRPSHDERRTPFVAAEIRGVKTAPSVAGSRGYWAARCRPGRDDTEINGLRATAASRWYIRRGTPKISNGVSVGRLCPDWKPSTRKRPSTGERGRDARSGSSQQSRASELRRDEAARISRPSYDRIREGFAEGRSVDDSRPVDATRLAPARVNGGFVSGASRSAGCRWYAWSFAERRIRGRTLGSAAARRSASRVYASVGLDVLVRERDN